MAAAVPALDEIVELRIITGSRISDQKLCFDPGIGGNQLSDDRDNRIIFVGNAKNDLVGRIIEDPGAI
jgi:hypothetical protein